jgi:beta-lactamase regulating signal transducer with metallopeptidase domain/catechol 2,3-dioxygenase-like lactoylglutathione lyase family enzyme
MMPTLVRSILTLSQSVELSTLSKTTILLVIGLSATRMATRARSSQRHMILAATFVALLALPLVAAIVPEMAIHLPGSDGDPASSATLLATETVASATGLEPTRQPTRDIWQRLPLVTIARAGWAIGALILLLSLAADLFRLRRMCRQGLPWPESRELIRTLTCESGIRRPVEVVLHGDAPTPVVCGFFRPTVVLPADAREWSEAELRRALVHELEHARRRDWIVQLSARAICDCYWFNPLVWMAWRRLCLEAERSCDDAVVAGADQTAYAEQLVLLARRLSKGDRLRTLGMANRSDLSKRVSALLDGSQQRGRVSVMSAACLFAAAALVTLVLGAVTAITEAKPPANGPGPATSGMEAQSQTIFPSATPDKRKEALMKINLTSVMVDDQAKALKFYTEILGFVKKEDIPMGEHRWLTVVSAEGPGDVELLLEPMGFPPARTYQKALFDAGIPAAMFAVEDIQREYERMEKLGVAFKTAPTRMGPVTIAVFEDTCGNLIQIAQR